METNHRISHLCNNCIIYLTLIWRNEENISFSKYILPQQDKFSKYHSDNTINDRIVYCTSTLDRTSLILFSSLLHAITESVLLCCGQLKYRKVTHISKYRVFQKEYGLLIYRCILWKWLDSQSKGSSGYRFAERSLGLWAEVQVFLHRIWRNKEC